MYSYHNRSGISIHAPRAGSDFAGGIILPVNRIISIHAPRAGSDAKAGTTPRARDGFQSTLPVRGATERGKLNARQVEYFNPRSPCGERLDAYPTYTTAQEFQSTLPVRGATNPPSWSCQTKTYFNPRSPCGERPTLTMVGCGDNHISIHAPRAGSDGA